MVNVCIHSSFIFMKKGNLDCINLKTNRSYISELRYFNDKFEHALLMVILFAGDCFCNRFSKLAVYQVAFG